ncbi:hypothetical protein H0I76_05930 [Limibaculum sp. M0105]|uniref:Uncharacterized protein n=1 Tax=Thermohalobaculum xanthum TaxID=2753746 RepID=A0A8J7M5C0_9RHOB|nr:hypothetical protein [Thermohalobaculum xanthum]MBK0398719.1 hypothetical protein [Thermohalobaculum xanthum]
MPGTLKIWWHDGATKDVRYNELPVANEPELGFSSLVVGPLPVSSPPAPEDATVAIIEADVNFRYTVVAPGGGADADPLTSKPMAATGFGTDTIGVRPGYRISVIEA